MVQNRSGTVPRLWSIFGPKHLLVRQQMAKQTMERLDVEKQFVVVVILNRPRMAALADAIVPKP